MNVITNNNIKCTVAMAGLRNVLDPEIGLNVVDFGLIYHLDFEDEDHKVHCTMTLTTRFCPMGESITDGVKAALQQSFPDNEAEVNITFDPAWNYEMISEEGRIFLDR